MLVKSHCMCGYGLYELFAGLDGGTQSVLLCLRLSVTLEHDICPYTYSYDS